MTPITIVTVYDGSQFIGLVQATTTQFVPGVVQVKIDIARILRARERRPSAPRPKPAKPKTKPGKK